MNFKLAQVPDRTAKPRQYGLTMVMDKGLSIRQIEDMLDISAPHIDIVKLGWATSFVTPNPSIDLDLALYPNYLCYSFAQTTFRFEQNHTAPLTKRVAFATPITIFQFLTLFDAQLNL